MKIVRFIAGLLMLVSAVWHVILAFRAIENRPMLAFAVAYLIIGILLLSGYSWGLYLGIIFPLSGIIIASIKIGWSNFDTAMTILISIDFIVILACLWMLLALKRPSLQPKSVK